MIYKDSQAEISERKQISNVILEFGTKVGNLEQKWMKEL
jgi:hypothetical protein